MIEYARFCGLDVTPFDCSCGSAACRRRVSSADHLAPWLEQLYGQHVSEYVAAARAKAAVLSATEHRSSDDSATNMQGT